MDDRMSAFRQGSDFGEGHQIPQSERLKLAHQHSRWATQTWKPCFGYHKCTEQVAFAVLLMISGRLDRERRPTF